MDGWLDVWVDGGMSGWRLVSAMYQSQWNGRNKVLPSDQRVHYKERARDKFRSQVYGGVVGALSSGRSWRYTRDAKVTMESQQSRQWAFPKSTDSNCGLSCREP